MAIGVYILQKYMMKDHIIKKIKLNFKRMMPCFFFILLNMLIPSVKSIEMSAKRCFLYPINENETSPWFKIPKSDETVVILEHMPKSEPVNITLEKYKSEDPDLYCLISIQLSTMIIYGNCILDAPRQFALNESMDDKILVFHVQESSFHVTVEDIVVDLIPSIDRNSRPNHSMSEWMDNVDISEVDEMKMPLYDNTQYMVQITSDISLENKTHAAVGCEYDMDDECTLEFGKTILCISTEITIMALSNSSKLDGEVRVHYGNTDFKRTKTLQITLPSIEDGDGWEEVATIIPTFMERGDNKSYVLILESNVNLIYSPRNPGLVGTVEEKKLILDFTDTKNVRWAVPCPEKPKSLKMSTRVKTTTESDAELFTLHKPGEDDTEEQSLGNIIGTTSQAEAEAEAEVEVNVDVDESESNDTTKLERTGGKTGASKSSKSSGASHVTGATMAICTQLMLLLTRSLFFLFYTATDIIY